MDTLVFWKKSMDRLVCTIDSTSPAQAQSLSGTYFTGDLEYNASPIRLWLWKRMSYVRSDAPFRPFCDVARLIDGFDSVDSSRFAFGLAGFARPARTRLI